MATVKNFEDLEIWQEARRLSQEIIAVSKKTDLKSDYRLRDQIKASAGETRSQLYRLFDNEYISDKKLKVLVDNYKLVSRRIANFMNYLNKEDFRGNKFKIAEINNRNLRHQTQFDEKQETKE